MAAVLISPGFEQKKLSFESKKVKSNISISLKLKISKRLCKGTDDLEFGVKSPLEKKKLCFCNTQLPDVFLMAVKWPLAFLNYPIHLLNYSIMWINANTFVKCTYQGSRRVIGLPLIIQFSNFLFLVCWQ